MEFRQEQGGLWEKVLPDNTLLIGEKGSGSHTHICPDFIKIKDEQTGQFMGWNMNENQQNHYIPPKQEPGY